ncbi:Motility protein [Bordetella tumbae]
MSEHEASLTQQLLAALLENTQAQNRLAQAIVSQADAIADLADAVAGQLNDDDQGLGITYLSGAPR